MQAFGRFLLGLAGIAALAACTSAPPPTEAAGLACPEVSILAEAARITQWKPGAGRDLTDVIASAELVTVTGDCIFPGRDTTKVVVQFAVAMKAEAGPANPTRIVDVPYFIALLDKDRRVITRERFTSRVEFPVNQSRMGFFDEFEHQITLPAGARAQDYSYFLGFELTPEELERNRSRLGS